MRPRRAPGARAAVAVLATLAVALPATSGSTSTVSPRAPSARAPSGGFADPALLTELASGPSLGLFGWDKDATSREQVRAYLESAGVSARIYEGISVGVACLAGAGQLGTLLDAPGVHAVYADQPLTPTIADSVPTAFNGDPADWWGVEGITGKGVGIFVIDTGIDATHPDLAFGTRVKRNVVTLSSHREILGTGDACVPDFYIPPENFYDPVFGEQLDDPEDSEGTSGHGTHLAGVAAGDGTASGGKLKGMAPEADLFGVQVIGDASPGQTITTGESSMRPSLVRAVSGIDYAIRHGFFEDSPMVPKVAILGFTAEGLYDTWNPLQLALRDLYDFGVAVIVPVGNEGPTQSACDQASTCHVSPMAASPYTVGVGATPKTSRTQLAPYSSVGDPVVRIGPDGEQLPYQPALVAPGTRVVAAQRIGLAAVTTIDGDHTLGGGGGGGKGSKWLGYQALTGTSVAAAHVAGAVALMQQAAVEAKGCFLATPQVYEILAQTATPMTGYAEHQVGSGSLDATAAIWGARFAPRIDSLEDWNCPPT